MTHGKEKKLLDPTGLNKVWALKISGYQEILDPTCDPSKFLKMCYIDQLYVQHKMVNATKLAPLNLASGLQWYAPNVHIHEGADQFRLNTQSVRKI